MSIFIFFTPMQPGHNNILNFSTQSILTTTYAFPIHFQYISSSSQSIALGDTHVILKYDIILIDSESIAVKIEIVDLQ